MIRQNMFEKKYSLLAPYILDESVRKNMLSNEDLLRKYDSNHSMIKAYINEIDKRFDRETINKMIIETIFKFSSPVLISFITAYLNSDEAAKSNPDVVQFYKKTLHQGTDVIKYVEENGIVTNRTFKEIPQKILDNKFNTLGGTRQYGNQLLRNLYPSLTTLEKQLLIEFLETNDYIVLNDLFSGFIPLKKLFMLLKSAGIDTQIINKKNVNALGEENMIRLVLSLFTLLGDINIKHDIEVVKEMLSNNRYDLINSLLTNDMIMYTHYLNPNYIVELSEEEMIDRINMSKVILEKSAA